MESKKTTKTAKPKHRLVSIAYIVTKIINIMVIVVGIIGTIIYFIVLGTEMTNGGSNFAVLIDSMLGNKLIDPFYWLYSFSAYSSIDITIIFAFVLVLLFGIELMLRFFFNSDIKMRRKKKLIIYNFLKIIIHLVMIFTTIFIFTGVQYATYISTVFDNNNEQIHYNSTKYFEMIQQQQGKVEHAQSVASVQLNKIIDNVEADKDFINRLSDEEYRDLFMQIVHLIDIKDGPDTPAEHYLRNQFKRAPLTLADMITAVQTDQDKELIGNC